MKLIANHFYIISVINRTVRGAVGADRPSLTTKPL
jgi:hypothetical protein